MQKATTLVSSRMLVHDEFHPPDEISDIMRSQLEKLETERNRFLLGVLNGGEEYLLDTNGYIRTSNLETTNICGYDEWEVVGMHFSKFYTKEDQLKGVPQEDLAHAEQKEFYTTTGFREKKRNTPFWAKVKFRALSSNGQLAGYKMVIKDITHTVIRSQKLRELRSENLNLFNNNFVGIIRFSLVNYEILKLNDLAHQILLPNKLKGKFNEYFKETDFNTVLNRLTKVGAIDNFEWKVPHREQWIKLSCRQFSNGSFAEGILVDSTQTKILERELTQARHELDQFIYHASHELRGPLVSILGITNLLEYKFDPAALHTYCSHIKTQIHKLDHLLQSIVALSLNNNNTIDRGLINWNEQIPILLKEFHEFDGIDTTITIAQSHPFYSDWKRLRVVLKNIITNAHKYTNPLTSPHRISIEIVSSEQHATIRIEDSGIGIGSDYLKKIFDMFFKASVDSRGQGLGLYTAKVMIEKLKGTIHVESAIGVGSAFTITLPNMNHLPQINIQHE